MSARCAEWWNVWTLSRFRKEKDNTSRPRKGRLFCARESVVDVVILWIHPTSPATYLQNLMGETLLATSPAIIPKHTNAPTGQKETPPESLGDWEGEPLFDPNYEQRKGRRLCLSRQLRRVLVVSCGGL